MPARVYLLDVNRFSNVQVELIWHSFGQYIATGRVIALTRTSLRNGEAIHLLDPEHEPVYSFFKEHRRIHVLNHKGRVIAGSARLEDAVDQVRKQSKLLRKAQ